MSRAEYPLRPTGDNEGRVFSSGDESGVLRELPVREVVEDDGAVVVRLGGELDVYNAAIVRDALLDVTGRAVDRRVVVDLAEVSFVDSTLLGVLVEARTRVMNRRAFLLAAPALEVRRALEVSGLDRHFEVHDTIESALAARLN